MPGRRCRWKDFANPGVSWLFVDRAWPLPGSCMACDSIASGADVGTVVMTLPQELLP